MNNYLKILRYALEYKRHLWLSVVFNTLTVLFSLGSITVLIPILKIIFNNTKKVDIAPVYKGFYDIKNYVEQLLNFNIQKYAAVIGIQKVLLAVMSFASVMFILKNLFRYLGAMQIVYIKNNVERDLRSDLHNKLLSLSPGYFTEQRKGDIISRMTNDLGEIQWALLSSIQRLYQEPLILISTLITLIILSAKLTLFVIILLPIAGVLITSIGNSLKKPAKLAREAISTIISQIEENITGMPVIQSFNAEKQIQKNFENANESYKKHMNDVNKKGELASPVSEVLGSLLMIAIVWFGSVMILENRELQPEVFITYIALFYQIITPMKNISSAIYDIKRGEASSQRLLQFLETDDGIHEVAEPEQFSTFEKSIEFKNIDFAYGEQKVLHNISFSVPKGKTIALVGQSGSGKTTLTYLLNRFYDTTKGTISIDNHDLKNLKKEDLRKMIGYISQEPILFNDSIRNNILLGKPNATEEEIIHACKLANAYDFIQEKELGLDENIGDRGNKLSGGQKQRLTIARAIIKDPPILILDEATSALDAESEKVVQDAMNHLMQNRTVIVVAHRLATIKNADNILVLNEGAIVEQGNHEDLYAQNGIYTTLVNIQNIKVHS
jgi:ATP-binding cassette, subfamily B, bacterial MsbA